MSDLYCAGKIVDDSDNFQDDKCIWPEGYTAMRKSPSIMGKLFRVDFLLVSISYGVAASFS